jgi:hypothetical protein
MSRTQLWVGLDVGADETTVCGTDDKGTVLFEHLVPTSAVALHALLKREKRRIKLIGLEVGSFGVTLTLQLRPNTIFYMANQRLPRGGHFLPSVSEREELKSLLHVSSRSPCLRCGSPGKATTRVADFQNRPSYDGRIFVF